MCKIKDETWVYVYLHSRYFRAETWIYRRYVRMETNKRFTCWMSLPALAIILGGDMTWPARCKDVALPRTRLRLQIIRALRSVRLAHPLYCRVIVACHTHLMCRRLTCVRWWQREGHMRFEKNMEPDQKSCTAQQDGPHSERTPSIILMLPTHYLSKKRHYLF